MMNVVSGDQSPLWSGFISVHRSEQLISDDTASEFPQLPQPRGSPNELDMTSLKQTRRAAARLLKSVVSLCFLALSHLKLPHDGCPSQYSHTTRMSGSFDTKRSSKMSGSFDSQRVSRAFGSFDTPRVSRVYGGYESRGTSKFICECCGCELTHPDDYNLPM